MRGQRLSRARLCSTSLSDTPSIRSCTATASRRARISSGRKDSSRVGYSHTSTGLSRTRASDMNSRHATFQSAAGTLSCGGAPVRHCLSGMTYFRMRYAKAKLGYSRGWVMSQAQEDAWPKSSELNTNTRASVFSTTSMFRFRKCTSLSNAHDPADTGQCRSPVRWVSLGPSFSDWSSGLPPSTMLSPTSRTSRPEPGSKASATPMPRSLKTHRFLLRKRPDCAGAGQ